MTALSPKTASYRTTTFAALERLTKTGRKLILVTGRELPTSSRCFPRLDLFDKVVAENGALLYTPATKKERGLGARPAGRVRRGAARRCGVDPAVGRPLDRRHLGAARDGRAEVIKELGLELEIIFNKGAVMVLPTGVNKATGLAAALEELGAFAAQRRRHRRRRERPCLSAHVGLRRRRRQRAAAVKETADLVTRARAAQASSS